MQNSLPYFGFLLSELAKGNATVETSFGRHVHWGYWENPKDAVGDAADYARAAEQMTLELCSLADIAPAGGNLADRIRALQTHASRVGPEDEPKAPN